jgi:hypothetical protein
MIADLSLIGLIAVIYTEVFLLQHETAQQRILQELGFEPRQKPGTQKELLVEEE